MLWLASRGEDRHGGIFAFLIALWFAPAGMLFLVAGAAHRHRWWGRWAAQVLAVVYFVLVPTQDPVQWAVRIMRVMK